MTDEEKQIETKNSNQPIATSVLALALLCIVVAIASGYAGGYLANRTIKNSSTNSKDVFVSQSSAIIDVVKKGSPAVVSIIVSKKLTALQNDLNPFFFDPYSAPSQTPSGNNNANTLQQVGAGSGFFVSGDGLILTNNHVVSDAQAKYTVITNDGKKYDATVVATDPIKDLALVKITITNAPTLNFADSTKIEIGQGVVAIGNSLGQYSNTVTSGIISGIGRNITAGGEGSSEQLEGVLQTDAAINPGNSGGPLLDIFGNVVGINTAIDQQGQSVGFAIPASDAKKDIESYLKSGKIITPFLGIRYVLIDDAVQQKYNLPVANGAWVNSDNSSDGGPAIVSGSAADKAGVKDGDIIVSVNAVSIDQNNTLAGLIKNYNPGDKLNLQVLRSGKTLNLTATLGQK